MMDDKGDSAAVPLWESKATDEQVAEALLADLNYKRMPYERAVVVTAHHVRRIREAARRDA